MGKPKAIKPPEYEEVKYLYMCGKIDAVQAGKELGVSSCTFWRWCEADGYVRSRDGFLKPELPLRKMDKLSRVAAEAKAAGMSYGKYKAMQYERLNHG